MAASNEREREEQQAEEAAQRQSPSSQIVHEAILKEGVEELKRPNAALAWSGLAGGLSMGFSLIAESMLHAALPDTAWRPLIAKLGYSVGFLIVILGRQQLFTENTLTPILPLLEKRVPVTLLNVLRLWAVVLAANLVGGAVIAWAITREGILSEPIRASMATIGHDALSPGFALIFVRGIFAGWLVALLVWLLPFAEAGRVWVIIIITYVIGVAQFSHSIAGSIEAFALAFTGEIGWFEAFTGFTIPALLGNVIGGVALVASLNHAQVVAGKND